MELKLRSPESGMEELLRLSKQIREISQQQEKIRKEHANRRQEVQGIQHGLIELKVSVALNQLESIATPEIFEQVVSSLPDEYGTLHLRKIILDLSSELEKWVDSPSDSKQDIGSVCRSLKTLIILLELLFSLE